MSGPFLADGWWFHRSENHPWETCWTSEEDAYQELCDDPNYDLDRYHAKESLKSILMVAVNDIEEERGG